MNAFSDPINVIDAEIEAKEQFINALSKEYDKAVAVLDTLKTIRAKIAGDAPATPKDVSLQGEEGKGG